jgi:hypothetical protein
MRPLWIAAALSLVMTAAAGAHDLRSQTKSYPVAGARRVALDLPPGEVIIAGTSDSCVRVSVSLHCDGSEQDCERRAARLELDQSRQDGTLSIDIHDRGHGWHHRGGVRTEVQVPRGLALTLNVGAGEVEVEDAGGDVRIELGAGQATLRLRDRDVSSVHASVGVGDVSLRALGRSIDSEGFISRSADWGAGHGKARVDVSVGAGQVYVRID